MKMQLRDFNSIITTLDQLKQDIKPLWVTRMEDSLYFKKLMESMPQRLQKIICKCFQLLLLATGTEF
jgi:hypothetical protein